MAEITYLEKLLETKRSLETLYPKFKRNEIQFFIKIYASDNFPEIKYLLEATKTKFEEIQKEAIKNIKEDIDEEVKRIEIIIEDYRSE